ncbi:MAG: hypothetical protein EOM90_15255 [Alphaproteobacteria bacterium]|nr:hypothetical protein [Alphaproteobacteria bacterium]
MKYFKKWMFIIIPENEQIKNQEKTQFIVEEANIKKEHAISEKMIVVFLYFLITICSSTLIISIIMLLIDNKNYKIILDIFAATLTYLIGYFFGTNKKRK